MEKNPCNLEKCVADCYKRKEKELKMEGKILEEIKDCDEVCAQLDDEKVEFAAINNECHLLPTATEEQKKIQKKCEICQNCKFKVDFVDVEVCPFGEGNLAISPFYKERQEEKFPIEEFYNLTKSEVCQKIDEEPFCEKEGNKCQCFKYDRNGKEILDHDNCKTKISDAFLGHPYFRKKEDEEEKFPTFECEISPGEKTSCPTQPQLQSFDFFQEIEGEKKYLTARAFIEKLKITTDIYEEFGNKGNGEKSFELPFSLFDETPSKKVLWWEWDKPSPLFSSFVSNGVVAGKCQGNQCSGSGLRWDFKIETLPKTQICDYGEENCFGEKEKEYPFCWKIEKRHIDSHIENFYENAEKILEEEEGGKKEKLYGIYRNQVLSLPYERVFSYRLKIKEKDSYLEYLPKIPTQSPVRFGLRISGKKFGIEFPIGGIWTSLPPLKDALGRLNKKFSFEFLPCGDETGFFCANSSMIQKAKITGATTTFPFEDPQSGPPPPRKICLRQDPSGEIGGHYFDWDPVLGAASYWLKFEGEEKHEKFVPSVTEPVNKSRLLVNFLEKDGKYTWQIRTCADLCSENNKAVLQCGEYGEKMEFEGYNLFAPKEFRLGTNAEFYPDEPIELSWKPVSDKGIDCTHLKIFYGVASLEEKRKDCREKANFGYVLVDKIMKGNVESYQVSPDLLPTSSEILVYKREGGATSTTNICLGTYTLEIYYCTGESCDKKIEECTKREDCPDPKDDPKGYLDCIDCLYSAECRERGLPTSRDFHIVTKKTPAGGRGGGRGFGTCQNLIPCTDCHFSDIPKIIANIMSCILWTLSPIACLLLLVYTGIGIYFSFGNPEVIEKTKRIWKAVGIGWLIMLLSWTIVNLIGKTFKMPGF
jgi:hypothetical protein